MFVTCTCVGKTHTRAFMCTHRLAQTHTQYTQTFVCTHRLAHTHTQTHTHTHTQSHTHIDTQKTHTHSHTQAHTHTQRQKNTHRQKHIHTLHYLTIKLYYNSCKISGTPVTYHLHFLSHTQTQCCLTACFDCCLFLLCVFVYICVHLNESVGVC